MRKLVFIFAFAFISFSILSQSNSIIPAEASDAQVLNQLLYQNAPEPGEDESKFHKQVQRDILKWQNHIYPSGNFDILQSAYHDYVEEYMGGDIAYYPIEWTEAGPVQTSNTQGFWAGRVYRLSFDPSYGYPMADGSTNWRVYASSAHGGLWRSDDRADNWYQLNTDNGIPIACAADVAISHSNPVHILLATGQPDDKYAAVTQNLYDLNPNYTVGVYTSTDDGETWQLLSLDYPGVETFGTFSDVVINPNNENEAYFASARGLFKVTNIFNGLTPVWEVLHYGENFRKVFFDTHDPSRIYAAGDNVYEMYPPYDALISLTGPGSGLDIEGDFPTPNGYYPVQINAVKAESNDYLFCAVTLMMIDSNDNRHNKRNLYVNINAAWSLLYEHIPYDVYTSVDESMDGLAVSPINSDQIFFGGAKVYGYIEQSTEIGFDNFLYNIENTIQSQFASSPYNVLSRHPDCRDLVFEPYVPGAVEEPRLFEANDGGVCSKNVISYPNSTYLGWERKSIGLSLNQLWTFDTPSNSSDAFLLAKQDDGTLYNNPKYGKILSVISFADGGSGDGYAATFDNKHGRFHYRSNSIVKSKTIQSFTVLSEIEGESGSGTNLAPNSASHNNFKAYAPQCHKIRSSKQSGEVYFGYSNIFRRNRKATDNDEVGPGSASTGLWTLSSDIHYSSDIDTNPIDNNGLHWMLNRMITDFEIAPTDDNFVYATTRAYIPHDNPWGDYGRPHFFVSTQGATVGEPGNPHFIDVIENLPNYNYQGETYKPIITGITVSDRNPEKVWVSIAGFDPQLKVLMSADTGNTWTNSDPNGTLHNLPINSIVCYGGEKEHLFAGTDAGVYYTNNTITGWQKFGDVPNVRVTEMKINRCANKLQIATFGRGMWEVQMPFEPLIVAERHVQENEIWDEEVLLESHLRVLSGNTLTVKDVVYLPYGGKVIIEPGAELIVDGGRITNECGFMWEGIEVWGNSSLDQSSPSDQGVLKLKNGAVIENAKCAVRLGHNITTDGWEIDWSKTGGIVTALDATFKNNLKDVEFLSYHNVSDVSGFLHNNKSRFTRCSFVIDATLSFSSNASTPESLSSRVSLYDVEGVSFIQCHFSIEDEALNYYLIKDRGVAIGSVESGFSLRGNCQSSSSTILCETDDLTCQTLNDPTSSYLPSSITGFPIGIIASAYSGGMPIQVSKTIFDSNLVGARFIGTKQSSFKENKVLLNENSYVDDPILGDATSIGVQFIGSSGYTISRNVFEGESILPGLENGIKVGVNVISSGDLAHEIYLNDFSGLFVGTVIQGKNRNNNNWDNTNEGLEVLCNNFNNTLHDIALTDKGSIAVFQGNWSEDEFDVTAPAGNVFEINHESDEGDIFVCNNCSWLVYLHHDYGENSEKVEPVQFSFQDVMAINQEVVYTDRASVCPIDKYIDLDLVGLKLKVDQKRDSISDLHATLQGVIDGGDTEGLINLLLYSFSSDLDIRDALLAQSPYLSDTVLTALVTRNEPVNQWIVCEILTANSPLSLDVLSEYSLAPLVDFLDRILMNYQNGISATSKAKAKIEAEISLVEAIVRDYVERTSLMVDSTNQLGATCSIIKDVFATAETNKRVKAQFPILLKEGRYSDAGILLGEYTPDCSNDIFVEFANIILSLDTSNMSAIVLTQLEQLASSGSIEGIQALVLLEEVTGVTSNYPGLVLPTEGTKSLVRNKVERQLMKLLEVSPNPAQDYFYVSYAAPPKGFENVVLRLTSIGGREVEIRTINRDAGVSFYDCSNLSNGTYIITLELDGVVIESKKIVIQ